MTGTVDGDDRQTVELQRNYDKNKQGTAIKTSTSYSIRRKAKNDVTKGASRGHDENGGRILKPIGIDNIFGNETVWILRFGPLNGHSAVGKQLHTGDNGLTGYYKEE